MADGGIGNQSPATLFQARLLTALGGGVTSILQLLQYAGNKVVVNGQTVVIPGGGVGLQRNVADNLITSAGADSGAPGAANTLYYVYVSNRKSPFSPSSIRLSATAPQAVNGVYYLGAAGNARNWRFVGWVRLNATPQFQSDQSNRLIVNYYNRINLSLFTCPGYLNNDTNNTYAHTSITYTALNGGVGASMNFIANGEDAIEASVFAMTDLTSGAGALIAAISLDSPTDSLASCYTQFPASAISISACIDVQPSVGYHTFWITGLIAAGATGGFFSELAKQGAVNDPPVTYIIANIPG